MSSPRSATIFGSCCRSVPEAALRGLAKVCAPSSSSSRFIFSKASRGRKTSPRTSTSAGCFAAPSKSELCFFSDFRPPTSDFNLSGTDRIVRTFCVTTSHAAREQPVFVNQRNAQPVNLQFRHIIKSPPAGQLFTPHRPLAQVVKAVAVIERHHGPLVAVPLEAFNRLSGHALRRAIGSDQVGPLLFEFAQPPHQRVVFDVRDDRLAEDIVAVIVIENLAAEFFNLPLDGSGFGSALGHRSRGRLMEYGLGGCNRSARINPAESVAYAQSVFNSFI